MNREETEGNNILGSRNSRYNNTVLLKVEEMGRGQIVPGSW